MDPPRLSGELPDALPPVSFNHFSVSIRPGSTRKCRRFPLVLAVIVVNDASPVMARFPVNVTPALVIVQSLSSSKVPDVSGDAAMQLHCCIVGKHDSFEGGKTFTLTTCLYKSAGHVVELAYEHKTP